MSREMKIKEVEKSLKKVKEALAKYGNPFEGKSTMEILKIIRTN